MSYMHTPQIIQSSIVISNSRKDLLAAAMRDAHEAAEKAQRVPSTFLRNDFSRERAARAEHLAALVECV